MTYLTTEASTQDGSPIDLYKFSRGLSTWLYTSAADEYTYLNELYLPESIERTSVNQKGDINKDSLSITLPRNNALAVTFLGTPLREITSINLLRGHTFDGDFISYWSGRVTATEAGGANVVLTCESLANAMRRHGIRARYQRGCRHALYDRGCFVDSSLFSTAGTVTNVNGRVITVTEAASQIDSYFSGGFVTYANGETEYITEHVGNLITVKQPPEPSITTITLYAGCDRSRSICETKFNNLPNFGGFPWIPTKNPFGGSSII